MSTHTHACIHYVDHVCPFHRLSSERAISNSGITKLSSFLPLSRSFSLSSSVHNTTSKSFLVLFLLGMYDAAGKSEGGAASARRRQTERPTGRTTEGVRWRSAYTFLSQTLFSSYSSPSLRNESSASSFPYAHSLIMITV